MNRTDASKRARADSDAVIREWQAKSDATYHRQAHSPVRRAIEAYRRSPLRFVEDAACVLAIFALTWFGLVVTGGN